MAATRIRPAGWFAAGLVFAGMATACGGGSPTGAIDVEARGRQAFSDYGCVACHTFPGVPEARGHVGPDLGGLDEQRLIAGQLPNTPENLAAWIRDPQSIAPGSGMPDVGVSEEDARYLVEFLYGQ